MAFPLRSIKAKLLLTLLAFGLIPFVVVGFFSIRTLKQEINEEMINKLILLVDGKANELFNYFDLIETRTHDFASDGFIHNAFEKIITQTSPETTEALVNHLVQNKKSLDPHLFHILLIDLKGKVIASTSGVYQGANLGATDYFRKGLKGMFVQEFKEPQLEKEVFVVSTPLTRKTDHRTLGVLVNFFDSSSLETLLAGELGYDPKGQFLLKGSPLQTLEVYMVNQFGEMLVRPKRGRSKNQETESTKVDTFPVQKCLSGKQALGGQIYRNYRGEKVMGVSVCFPERDWIIISEVTTHEAFASLRWTYLKLGLLIALFFLTILLFALVLSRKVTEPLQRVTQTVRRVREGDLNARLKVSSGDEIGQLMGAFNEMTEKLKFFYASLERKVKQKTRALHQKVIRIQEEKTKDEAVLESIGDGIIMTRPDGKIAIVNKAAQQILGWSNQVLGKELASILTLEDDQEQPILQEKQPIHLALKQGKKAEGVYYYLAKNQPKFPIRVIISPVVLNQEKIGAIMVFRDVTKEKEVDRMKNEFVSLVSHQLRTPLSGMKWFAEMFLSGDLGMLNAEQREFITHINELNDRMIALVNALLNISRIESGRIIIDPQPTRLGNLVREVLTSLQTKVKEKNLTVILSINEHLPLINIDPKLIREVYSNLLSNAVKYTPVKGEITIFISEKDQEIISQINDTGYGIPKKEQHKVFQKFYRGSNIVSVETDGNGLGMYLVKAIIESSGGQIWFRSEESKGATFWFSLPKSGMKARSGEVTLNS